MESRSHLEDSRDLVRPNAHTRLDLFRDFDGKSKLGAPLSVKLPGNAVLRRLVIATATAEIRFFRDYEGQFTTMTEPRNLRARDRADGISRFRGSQVFRDLGGAQAPHAARFISRFRRKIDAWGSRSRMDPRHDRFGSTATVASTTEVRIFVIASIRIRRGQYQTNGISRLGATSRFYEIS